MADYFPIQTVLTSSGLILLTIRNIFSFLFSLRPDIRKTELAHGMQQQNCTPRQASNDGNEYLSDAKEPASAGTRASLYVSIQPSQLYRITSSLLTYGLQSTRRRMHTGRRYLGQEQQHAGSTSPQVCCPGAFLGIRKLRTRSGRLLSRILVRLASDPTAAILHYLGLDHHDHHLSPFLHRPSPLLSPRSSARHQYGLSPHGVLWPSLRPTETHQTRLPRLRQPSLSRHDDPTRHISLRDV